MTKLLVYQSSILCSPAVIAGLDSEGSGVVHHAATQVEALKCVKRMCSRVSFFSRIQTCLWLLIQFLLLDTKRVPLPDVAMMKTGIVDKLNEFLSLSYEITGRNIGCCLASLLRSWMSFIRQKNNWLFCLCKDSFTSVSLHQLSLS